MPLFVTPATTGLVYAEPLASGECTYPRSLATWNALSLSTQVLSLSYWTAATSGTATTVTTVTGGTAASGLTYANIGIYAVAANGNLTLLASTGDLHASLWTSTFTNYASTLTASFSRQAGVRYALGLLAVGTTPPALSGNSVEGWFSTVSPTLCAVLSGQSTLPSTVTAGSLGNGVAVFTAVVAP